MKELPLRRIGEELGVSLFHLELFGLWKCQWKQGEYYQDKTAPQVEALTLTPFGKKMVAIIATHTQIEKWNKHFKKQTYFEESFLASLKVAELIKAGKSEKKAIQAVRKQLEEKEKRQKSLIFEAPFQALFPKDTLSILEIRSTIGFLSGTYTFKVNLTRRKTIWRRIQLDATATLEDLHMMIQRAFQSGNDHLYAFYMDGKRFSELSYNDPRGGDGPFADDIQLGACEELEINRKILYIFDFGSEQHYDVVLEKIEETDITLKRGQIIESKGELPRW